MATDARTHVAAGLARLLAAEPGLPDGDAATRWLHRLLDEVGSDHRALAEFLCTVAASGAVDEARRARDAGERWDAVRSRLVMRLAGAKFYQPEMVGWALDAWGRALGFAPPPGVT